MFLEPYEVTVINKDSMLDACFNSIDGIIVKAYYHQLEPGQVIALHRDVAAYFNIVRRYQIFMDVPAGFSCGQKDSELRPWYVHSFNAREPHSYENASSEAVGFFVFDKINEDQKIHFKWTPE